MNSNVINKSNILFGGFIYLVMRVYKYNRNKNIYDKKFLNSEIDSSDKLEEIDVSYNDNSNKPSIEFATVKSVFKNITQTTIDYLMKVYKYIDKNDYLSTASSQELVVFKSRSI
jgi:hypothetical protein